MDDLPPPPGVTFCPSLVAVWGPGQSPVFPFAQCVGSPLSVRSSGWCLLRRLRVSGAQQLVCWGCGWCCGGGAF